MKRVTLFSAFLIVTLSVSAFAVGTVVLRNGTTISPQPGEPFTYWNCEDTFIDDVYPEGNYGASSQLKAGAVKKLLIKFGDLERALGPGKNITSAALVLNIKDAPSTEGMIVLLKVLASWGEGGGTDGRQVSPFSANWYYRHAPSGSQGYRWGEEGAEARNKDISEKALVEIPYLPKIDREKKQSRQLRIELPTSEVQDIYNRWYANHGWMILFTGMGEFIFSSSDDVRVEDRPALELQYRNPQAGEPAADFSVTCIERTPEYHRYGVGYDKHKKWPEDGEIVTFTAHVKNVGAPAASGFTYEWRINDVVVKRGSHKKALKQGEEITFSIPWKWKADHSDHRDQTVSFIIDPENKVTEAAKANNCLKDYIEGLSLAFYVEQSVYDHFKHINASGSTSCEDWLQWQVRMLNDVYMARSRYPGVAPEGSVERVRIQRISIVPDGSLKGDSLTPDGRRNLIYDGEIGLTWNSKNAEVPDAYTAQAYHSLDKNLFRRISREIGLIDLGIINAAGFTDPCPGLMGGGDTRRHPYIGNGEDKETACPEPSFQSEPLGLYSSQSIGALNADTGKRRGVAGDYLYDLPEEVFLKIVNALDGGAIPEAEIEVYQAIDGIFRDEKPVFRGKADIEGRILLPNRDASGLLPKKSITGKELKPNPFDLIDPEGKNGVLMVKVTAFGQTDKQFFKIHELNNAYWRGFKESYTYPLRVRITPKVLDDGNAALKTPVSVVGEGGPGNPSSLTDGDYSSSYTAPGGRVSSLIIDLGKTLPVAEIKLVQKVKDQGFWQQFRIDVSATEEFKESFGLIAGEPDWKWALDNRGLSDPEDPQIRWVIYRSGPVYGRYIRIANLSGKPGSLAEIEVRTARR